MTTRSTAQSSQSSSSTPQWTPRQLIDTALLRVHANGDGARLKLDPVTLMHAESRTVQKDGVTVSGIEFWSEALRPWTGRMVEVRYDAAAADRGHLREIVVRLEYKGEITTVHCPPRASMQDVLDRKEVRQRRMAYRASLKDEVEQAEVGSARVYKGAAAAARQEALHRKRRVQGRPGQEHSGHEPPRPEVEQGVKDLHDQVLRRKAKNHGIGAKDTSKRKDQSRNSRRSSTRGTGPQQEPSAQSNPWQDMAADSGASTTKAKRHSA